MPPEIPHSGLSAGGADLPAGSATPSLWGALDLMLEAYGITHDDAPEVAIYAITAALELGQRLSLPDPIVLLMGKSAAAEARGCPDHC